MIRPVGTTIFLAARFATALGITPRAVRRALADVPASGYLDVRGQQTPGWTLQSARRVFGKRLEERAVQGSYEHPFDLLTQCANQWQPEIPLSELDPACIEKASRLREVLAPVLRRGSEDASTSDLTREALTAFARLCHYELRDGRSVRRWIERARDRDRGRTEWERVELYLDDRLTRRVPVDSTRHALLSEASILQATLNLLENPLRASMADKDNLWRAAMDEIARRMELGQGERTARAEVLDVLSKCGAPLAANRAALERSLRRKHQRWQENGGQPDTLKDRRADTSGFFRKVELPEQVKTLFLARLVNTGGRVAQAYRELWEEKKFPAEWYNVYTLDACDKSRVPKAIAELCPRGQIEAVMLAHQSPKELKRRGPKCQRDWQKMPSGVQAQSDDCTLPVYFYIALPDGSFKLLRGQFLPYIDTRSAYIYCFQLLPTESYGSVDLGRGLVQLNDVFGLPESLYFEKGIWQNSLIIAGRGDEVPFKERVYGLRDLGLKVIHALDPSAKRIENVLGILQNRMERERGYCGRDERRDCPEFVAKAKLAVASGRAHPSQFFYSYAEWVERLNKICDAYNDEPQTGEIHQGLSPRQTFVKCQVSPPTRLDETTRYLLASHRREVKVTLKGLTIKIGKTLYQYKSEATGQLIGQTVLAWFDLEDPAFITITTMDHKNPVVVKRSTVLAAYNATPGAIAQAKRENHAHMAPVKLIYSALRKDHPEEFGGRTARRVVTDEATRALGAEIDRQKTALKTEAARTQRTRRAVNESATRAGLQLPQTDDPRRLEGQKKLAALMNLKQP